MSPPRLRLVLAAVLTGIAVAAAQPALAHVRATLEVVGLPDGSVVAAGDVAVTVQATGPETAATEFTMRLDGRPVDTSGRIGATSVFTTFAVRSGEQVVVRLQPVPAGTHELRVVYAPDADDPRPDLVRRFRAVEPEGTSSSDEVGSDDGSRRPPVAPVAALLAALLATGAATAAVLRRRRRTRDLV